jgi:ATP-dependent Clp protease protease subunit
MSEEKKSKRPELITQLLGYEEYAYHKALENREIIFNTEVGDDLVERVIMHILHWNREDAEIEESKKKPITIYLNTGGGQVDIGLALCSVIKASKTPVHVVILGMAASMGALLAIVAHKTFAYEYSDVLIHDGSCFMMGSTNKVKDHMRFQEEKEAQIKDLIVSNTKITSERYDEQQDREWWMTAKTAMEYGIVDEIIK